LAKFSTLKKKDFDISKGFFMEKMVNIFSRFQRKNIPNHLNFMMSFSMVAKDIEGF